MFGRNNECPLGLGLGLGYLRFSLQRSQHVRRCRDLIRNIMIHVMVIIPLVSYDELKSGVTTLFVCVVDVWHIF